MNSSITIDDRKRVNISGVISVERFTENEVFLFTEDGDLLIKGSGFNTEEFVPETKSVRIQGSFDSLTFITEKHHLADNFISRLFK